MYHELLHAIFAAGFWYEDPKRKGTKRLQIPDYKLKYDLTKGFPAITTKKLAFKSVVGELLWFLKGDTNVKTLIDQGINIWNKDAYNAQGKKYFPDSIKDYVTHLKSLPNKKPLMGDLGPIYGHQWRNFNGVDQIKILIKKMKTVPMSTDLIVTAWNPSQSHMMALEPCHFGFQIMMQPLTGLQRHDEFLRRHKGELLPAKVYTQEDLDEEGIPKYGFTFIWSQRSVDTFLGLPFNIASYALLAHILGKATNTIPLSLIGDLRNVHLYDNSVQAAKEQLKRDPKKYQSCELTIENHFIEGLNVMHQIEDIEIEDFSFDYESYPPLKVEMLSRNN